MQKNTAIIIIILGSILCFCIFPLADVLSSLFLLVFGTLILYKLDAILDELRKK